MNTLPTNEFPPIYQNLIDKISKNTKPNDYSPPVNYKNIPVLHIKPNDKHADLPLLISCENGNKAIIPTYKNVMRAIAPDNFKVFNNQNNFAESKHENGEIYQITIPGLKQPDILRQYLVFKECLVLDNRPIDHSVAEKTFAKLLIQNLTNKDCMKLEGNARL